MHYLLPLLAVLLFLAGCTREGGGANPAGGRAAQLEKEGRWAEAAGLRRGEALRMGPGKWEGSIQRALADYLMADRLEEAERFTAECLEKSPGSHEVIYYLGDCQRVMMRYEAARATLEKLLQGDPGHPRGTFALAHVLLRLGQPAEALALLDRFLSSSKGAEDLRILAQIEYGRALRRLGRPLESAERLCEVLEADPYNTVALSEAAQDFSLLGKTELAKGLHEEHAWLFSLGHQLSSEDESKVYPTGAASEGAVAREALQAADRREFLRATAKLEELVAANPAEAALAGPLARIWLRLFRFHDALRVLALSLSRAGESPDLLRARADANHGLGRIAEERGALRRASAVLASSGAASTEDPRGSFELHLRAGLLELEPGGSLEESEQCFARAALAAPGDWRLLFGRGRGAMERGDMTKALELFAAALQSGRDDGGGSAELRRWSAVARGLSGDLASAAREIMSLVRESPGDLENYKAFERVFASKRSELEVARVLELKKRLEEKIGAMDAALRSAGEAPFASSGPGYLALGKLFLGEGSREKALDCLFLAAELEPSSTEGLHLAQGALRAPRETFLRLHALRSLLERSPADGEALKSTARLYLDLGLRLDEAKSLALRLQALRPDDDSAKLLAEVRERLSGK